MTPEELDNPRPYTSDEIPSAMQRIAQDPTLTNVLNWGFPGIPHDDIRQKIMASRTADQFQENFSRPLLESIISKTMSGFTVAGLENINADKGYTYISNHRDIILDGALLQLVLMKYAGIPTSEITFGSNLIISPFVEDFGRSNKMYKILRGGSSRDLVINSRVLSEHLHQVVAEGRSIWISQRDGRTKDGNDRTDQGLVKMFTMTEEDTAHSLTSLNLLPYAISYEYEPCDALKTQEIYLRRHTETYEKAPGDDLRSMLTGVQQYKGHVHIEVCKPILPSEIEALKAENTNEMMRGVATLIDDRVFSGYRLYDTNYMAYDHKTGTNTFSDHYSPEAKEAFIAYLDNKIAALEGDRDELLDIMLDIYSNPVVNKSEFVSI